MHRHAHQPQLENRLKVYSNPFIWTMLTCFCLQFPHLSPSRVGKPNTTYGIQSSLRRICSFTSCSQKIGLRLEKPFTTFTTSHSYGIKCMQCCVLFVWQAERGLVRRAKQNLNSFIVAARETKQKTTRNATETKNQNLFHNRTNWAQLRREGQRHDKEQRETEDLNRHEIIRESDTAEDNKAQVNRIS